MRVDDHSLLSRMAVPALHAADYVLRRARVPARVHLPAHERANLQESDVPASGRDRKGLIVDASQARGRMMVSPGERRRRQRKRERDRIAYEAAIAPLRAAGANCGNCRSFKRGSAINIGVDKHYCAVESDFHGYAIARAEEICPHHVFIEAALSAGQRQ